jgi:DsbC/DsbD-like thiol-disulfide interchange protein
MPRILAILVTLLTLSVPAVADTPAATSVWSKGSHSSVRLIAGGRNSDGAFRIGVEIQMAPGFKTYWRMPGDAGVPPVFDWAGSENVGSVAVRWPAPKRYVDGQVTTIGYKERVIFPAIIRAADPSKPTVAVLKLDYAVCDVICIPAKAEASLRLPDAAETAQTAELDRFRALVPRPKEPGKLSDRPGLVAATGDKTLKTVDLILSIPAGARVHEVFLEGPEGWHFGTPTTLQTEPERLTVRVPVEERPKSVVGLAPVMLTITGEPFSSEIRFDLDITNANAR